jgi:hypothetical protein
MNTAMNPTIASADQWLAGGLAGRAAWPAALAITGVVSLLPK